MFLRCDVPAGIMIACFEDMIELIHPSRDSRMHYCVFLVEGAENLTYALRWL